MTRFGALALLVSSAAAAQEDVSPPDAGAPVSEYAHQTWLKFDGQRVLTEEVYRAMLRLPADAQPDLATAERVQHQVTRFLRSAGYELAHVDVQVDDAGLPTAHIHVTIDEGALEKVVFVGRQTLQTIRFKLALDIPHDVFNRPELERQVARLAKQLGLGEMRLVLAPSSEVKHVGPQLDSMPEMPEVKGFELLHELRRYELHIVLPDKDWDTGLGVDVRFGGVNGLEVLGNYQGRGGLFQDDRWRVNGGFGIALRNAISTEVHFSRAAVQGQYFFPAIKGELRPALEIEAELLSRLRRDINLLDYYASTESAALWLEWEPRPGIRIQFGGGLFDRRIFWLLPYAFDPSQPLAQGARAEAGTRPFGALRFDFTFDPENERWDRHHTLFVQLQQQGPGIGGEKPFAWARAYYQQVLPFGWHDVWVRALGFATWYASSFHDEQPLSDYMRGAFPNDFVRRVGSVNAEFRFSINRDVLKVSLQSMAALYTHIDREADSGPVRVAFAGGPGLHLLLEGMFQLDAYLIFGVRSPNDTHDWFSVAFSANLGKAF